MTATSDERRKVAERLRDSTKRNECIDESIVKAIFLTMNKDKLYSPTGSILADLIDPTCIAIEKGRPDENHVCYVCAVCGYEWYEDVHDKLYTYCPNCGRRLVGKVKYEESSK